VGRADLVVGEIEAETQCCKQERRDLLSAAIFSPHSPGLTSRYDLKSRTGLDNSMTN
jgi:hypothetical protein